MGYIVFSGKIGPQSSWDGLYQLHQLTALPMSWRTHCADPMVTAGPELLNDLQQSRGLTTRHMNVIKI